MRVVAGNYGGRRLKAVPGMKTRPTTDKVKEALFNIIGPYFDGGYALDLFAGSGGLSIEAVSRGMSHAYLVDRQYQAIQTIKENIAITKEPEKFSVYKADAHKILAKFSEQNLLFDYVFLDPPYKQQKILATLAQLVDKQLLAKDALIVCETDQEASLPEQLANFTLVKQAKYGISILTFYRYQGE